MERDRNYQLEPLIENISTVIPLGGAVPVIEPERVSEIIDVGKVFPDAHFCTAPGQCCKVITMDGDFVLTPVTPDDSSSQRAFESNQQPSDTFEEITRIILSDEQLSVKFRRDLIGITDETNMRLGLSISERVQQIAHITGVFDRMTYLSTLNGTATPEEKVEYYDLIAQCKDLIKSSLEIVDSPLIS